LPFEVQTFRHVLPEASLICFPFQLPPFAFSPLDNTPFECAADFSWWARRRGASFCFVSCLFCGPFVFFRAVFRIVKELVTPFLGPPCQNHFPMWFTQRCKETLISLAGLALSSGRIRPSCPLRLVPPRVVSPFLSLFHLLLLVYVVSLGSFNWFVVRRCRGFCFFIPISLRRGPLAPAGPCQFKVIVT